MSNIIVDGFATYGTTDLIGETAVKRNMLAGAWTAFDAPYNFTLTKGLPWDGANSDCWLTMTESGTGSLYWKARRALPAAKSVVGCSLHVAVDELPGKNNVMGVISWRDSANEEIASLRVDTTGVLRFDYVGGVLLTSGPVIVAEKDHHVEMWLDVSEKTFQLNVDGVTVINGTAIGFSNTNDVAQAAIVGRSYDSVNNARVYVSHLIVRDDAGTYNSAFPIGDRRVATLVPNRDDATADGWNAQPLLRFGVGVLDMTGTNPGAFTPASTGTDIGANDFTLEGQFRFQNLPSGANKATLFGKWDGDNDKRSYELYLGGPSLDNGLLVWRTSTDGTGATVADVVKWQWQPAVGHWYHVAMCRDGGVLKLFIDGVQQGLDVADSDTYFAGTARMALGCEMSGTNVEANTSIDGWNDEFRFTLGTSRYSANFIPPTEGFPRTASDPSWGSVVWLSSWDNGTVTDDGPNALALSVRGAVAAITPNDGVHEYEVLDKIAPDDDTFLEAALIPATGLFTMLANPTAAETVTVGTKADTTAAVYTFVSALTAAYNVLIGADVSETAANLVAAVNKATGEGVTYGTGTTANADVSAVQLPSNQVRATALTPGTIGNAIASTDTCATASWGATTLDGGLDIPAASQFGWSRMPSNTTIVDSITFATRQWKTDSGLGTTRLSLVGISGGEAAGTVNVLGGTANLTFDTFEQDPDTAGALTPTTVLGMQAKLDRTV